jgi:hypothetical protein
MLRSFFKSSEIEFLCEEEDWGVIPEPFPARKFIPDWFKALPPKLDKGLTSSTVKRCPPFLDAMQLGWIIPLAGDVEFKTSATAGKADFSWTFYKTLVETHNYRQVTTDKAPNPILPKPPLKFLNYWSIKVPKGYSLLFVPPLNRPDPRFECMSGLVDCDGYEEFINFPFTFNQPDFHGIIEAGTPLIQVIPIKRDTLFKEANIRQMSKKEIDKRGVLRRRRKSHESIYRDQIWERK